MKIEKTDLGLLFRTGAPSAAIPSPASVVSGLAPSLNPAPAPLLASRSAKRPPYPSQAGPQAQGTSLVGMLKRAGPALWHKLDANALSRRERRSLMLKKLSWLAEKNFLLLQENVKQPYLGLAGKVDGRLHAVLSSTQEVLALELCYELDELTLRKLYAAYRGGKTPVLLWAGPAIGRVAVLAKVATLLHHVRKTWLEVVLLD